MSLPLPITEDRPLRIGTLGAAKITPMALLAPARRVAETRVVAIAARDAERARQFAQKNDIPRVHADYADLIADPEIDAIYNPLPNSHHCEWTIRALEAGKHVLCEKPLASNAEEARQMSAAAERADRLLMEAFHWRYHPVAEHAHAALEENDLGPVQHIDTAFCVPLLSPGNIRYRLDLSGGSTMDLGAYTVNMIRYFGGAEPDVISARAKQSSPGIDRWMRAEMAFPDGRTARMTVSLCSWALLKLTAEIRCENGSVRLFNPIAPQVYHRLTVRSRGTKSIQRVAGEPTYTGQLRAFVDGVRTGNPPPTDGRDGVANMAVIDSIYEHAGLTPRGR